LYYNARGSCTAQVQSSNGGAKFKRRCTAPPAKFKKLVMLSDGSALSLRVFRGCGIEKG